MSNIHKENWYEKDGHAIYTQTGWNKLPDEPIVNDDLTGILFILLILAIFLLVVIFFYLWQSGNINVTLSDILFLLPPVDIFQ